MAIKDHWLLFIPKFVRLQELRHLRSNHSVYAWPYICCLSYLILTRPVTWYTDPHNIWTPRFKYYWNMRTVFEILRPPRQQRRKHILGAKMCCIKEASQRRLRQLLSATKSSQSSRTASTSSRIIEQVQHRPSINDKENITAGSSSSNQDEHSIYWHMEPEGETLETTF